MPGYICGASQHQDLRVQSRKPLSCILSLDGDRKFVNVVTKSTSLLICWMNRCYYLLIGLNFTSGLLYVLFYHPPTFHMKYRNRTKMQQVKIFDYVGAILFTAGLILFEIGFLWGGSV